MSLGSDEGFERLKLFSDQRRCCIIKFLSGSNAESYSLEDLQKSLLAKCNGCARPNHIKCKEGCNKPNLCKHLRVLEKWGLIFHDVGKQGKWFPIPQEIYVKILKCIEELDLLTSIGDHVSKIFLLYPPIKFEADENKKSIMLNQFSHHVKTLFEPKNFNLMSAKLTWKVYQKTIDLNLDLSKLV